MAKKKAKVDLPTIKRDPLTLRETEVCSLISKDLDNKAIGKSLGISVETVKEHVQNSLRKTKLLTPQPRCNPALLKKLRDGASADAHLLPIECRDLLEEQGLI